MYITTYGFDPALAHGVLVKTVFSFLPEQKPKLVGFDVLYTWDKNSPYKLTSKSSPSHVAQLCHKLKVAIFNQPKGTLAVDWDPYSVFWGSQKLQAVTLAYFMGYLSSCMITHHPVAFIPPKKVRSVQGLKTNNEKIATQENAWDLFDMVDSTILEHIKKSQDMADATVLGFVAAKAEWDNYLKEADVE